MPLPLLSSCAFVITCTMAAVADPLDAFASGHPRSGAAPRTDPAPAAWCLVPRKSRSAEQAMSEFQIEIAEAGEDPATLIVSDPQDLPMGFGPGQFTAVDVLGTFQDGAATFDFDAYEFDIKKGDVVGIAVEAEGPVPAGMEFVIFEDDVVLPRTMWPPSLNGVRTVTWLAMRSSFLPRESPLPFVNPSNTDNTDYAWVAPRDERFRFTLHSERVYGLLHGEGELTSVPASGTPYRLKVRLARPGPETSGPQKIFLDFDGEFLANASEIFEGANETASLSPLVSFLDDWGLTPADEDAVIDEILETVESHFNALSDTNPNVSVELLNSRDHADPFGLDPAVSRVIVGGSTEELGLTAYGIAELIDPGNHSFDDTAIVMLDRMGDPSEALSIPTCPKGPGVSVIEVAGRIIGGVVAHEVGHYVGCFHTENSNTTHNIMDAGTGGTPITGEQFRKNIAGVGEDGLLGTDDDNPAFRDEDVHASSFDTLVGFGANPVRTIVAFGLTGPLVPACPGDTNGDLAVNVDDLNVILSNWLVNVGVGSPFDLANNDGVVNVDDLNAVLGQWGSVCTD